MVDTEVSISPWISVLFFSFLAWSSPTDVGDKLVLTGERKLQSWRSSMSTLSSSLMQDCQSWLAWSTQKCWLLHEYQPFSSPLWLVAHLLKWVTSLACLEKERSWFWQSWALIWSSSWVLSRMEGHVSLDGSDDTGSLEILSTEWFLVNGVVVGSILKEILAKACQLDKAALWHILQWPWYSFHSDDNTSPSVCYKNQQS